MPVSKKRTKPKPKSKRFGRPSHLKNRPRVVMTGLVNGRRCDLTGPAPQVLKKRVQPEIIKERLEEHMDVIYALQADAILARLPELPTALLSHCSPTEGPRATLVELQLHGLVEENEIEDWVQCSYLGTWTDPQKAVAMFTDFPERAWVSGSPFTDEYKRLCQAVEISETELPNGRVVVHLTKPITVATFLAVRDWVCEQKLSFG